MSGASVVVLGVSAVYLACCIALGMLPGRKASDTAAGYVAGDRTLGLFQMYFITGASIFSAFAFLGLPGWAYSRGAAAFFILGYGTLGLVPFYFLGPRAARLGRAYGFVTQAEMVAARFRMPSLSCVMALVSVTAFVPYLALQMKGAGYVLNVVSRGDIPEWLGSGIVYAVVLLYVWRSGVLGVGWTNTFQGMFMMLLAWGLGLYLPITLFGGVGELFSRITEQRPELLQPPGLDAAGDPWTWGEYTSAVLVSTVGFSTWPHLFMKAFTARSDRTLRRTAVLYPTFQLFLVPLLFIGFSGVLFTPRPEFPDQVLPHILMHMDIPVLLVGLFCAGALAASMSSGDAMAHAAASIAVRDGAVSGFGARLDPEAQRRWIRRCLLVFVPLSYGVALAWQGSLVNLLLMAYGAVVQFAPGLAATLYSRKASGRGVLAGMAAGFGLTLLFTLCPEIRPWGLHAGLYGLVLNLLVLVVVSLLDRREGPPDEGAFLGIALGG